MVSESTEGKSWNSRVKLDPLFWMTQYLDTEDTFWESGERDWRITAEGLSVDWLSSARTLDVGCGIGRLLKTAASVVSSVTGFDISSECIRIAKKHFQDAPNVDFVLGDGIKLSGFVGTYDLVYSFAALPHLTPETFAQYLLDIRAITHCNSRVRLQLYLGEEVLFSRDDTFSLRSYRQEKFVEACNLAGFEVEWISKIALPFEAADNDRGRIPMIVALRPISLNIFRRAEVIAKLCHGREPDGRGEGSLDEYRYLVTYANALIRKNNLQAAEKVIEFAIQSYKNVDFETKQALERIRALRR